MQNVQGGCVHVALRRWLGVARLGSQQRRRPSGSQNHGGGERPGKGRLRCLHRAAAAGIQRQHGAVGGQRLGRARRARLASSGQCTDRGSALALRAEPLQPFSLHTSANILPGDCRAGKGGGQEEGVVGWAFGQAGQPLRNMQVL